VREEALLVALVGLRRHGGHDLWHVLDPYDAPRDRANPLR
jgi:hypothetical protein